MRIDIERLRKRKFWSRSRLGREAHVHPNTLEAIEKGESFPRAETMERIAKALGCTVEELIIEDDIPTPNTTQDIARLRPAS